MEIIYNWRVFQQAMLDYRRVREQAQSISCLVNSRLTSTIVNLNFEYLNSSPLNYDLPVLMISYYSLMIQKFLHYPSKNDDNLGLKSSVFTQAFTLVRLLCSTALCSGPPRQDDSFHTKSRSFRCFGVRCPNGGHFFGVQVPLKGREIRGNCGKSSSFCWKNLENHDFLMGI